MTFNDAPFDTYSYDTEGGQIPETLTRCANWWYKRFLKISLEAKDTIGIAGGTFDPPVWHEVERVFARSKADFLLILSPQSFDTSPISKPVREDGGRLKGST